MGSGCLVGGSVFFVHQSSHRAIRCCVRLSSSAAGDPAVCVVWCASSALMCVVIAISLINAAVRSGIGIGIGIGIGKGAVASWDLVVLVLSFCCRLVVECHDGSGAVMDQVLCGPPSSRT